MNHSRQVSARLTTVRDADGFPATKAGVDNEHPITDIDETDGDRDRKLQDGVLSDAGLNFFAGFRRMGVPIPY